jgi:hypothetical protein
LRALVGCNFFLNQLSFFSKREDVMRKDNRVILINLFAGCNHRSIVAQAVCI